MHFHFQTLKKTIKENLPLLTHQTNSSSETTLSRWINWPTLCSLIQIRGVRSRPYLPPSSNEKLFRQNPWLCIEASQCHQHSRDIWRQMSRSIEVLHDLQARQHEGRRWYFFFCRFSLTSVFRPILAYASQRELHAHIKKTSLSQFSRDRCNPLLIIDVLVGVIMTCCVTRPSQHLYHFYCEAPLIVLTGRHYNKFLVWDARSCIHHKDSIDTIILLLHKLLKISFFMRRITLYLHRAVFMALDFGCPVWQCP